MPYNRFKNREEAAKSLVQELIEYREKNPVVLAIPRGGVILAHEICKELNAPLDLIIPRKIGAANNPELAIGAVTEDGTTILNQSLVTQLGVPREYIEREKERQIEEIKRRIKAYREYAAPQYLEEKTAILVDDGIATGATMKASIYSIRKKKPSSIVVAVPVGPPETIEELKKEVNRVICLIVFKPFFAIGQFYEDFTQVSDEEVIKILKISKKKNYRTK